MVREARADILGPGRRLTRCSAKTNSAPGSASPWSRLSARCCSTFSVVATRSARFGYLSAAALATCGLWPGFARGVTCDLTLTVAIELALLSFFLWESKESRAGADRLWYVFCFALGLATLAKGLVGVVLPLVIIAPYLILTGGWKSLLRPRLIIFGAVIFLATAAVWYAPVIAEKRARIH